MLKRLQEAGDVVKKAIDEIQDHYGADGDELFRSFKYRNKSYVQKVVTRAVAEATLKKRSRFVVAIQGTSVTAGHDNYFNQSYPLVLQRVAKDAFAAIGLDLVVRNHAMGNNPTIPASFCVLTQLGSDTDVAVWEFGMMVGGEQHIPWIEHWVRNAASLPRQPAIMFIDPGEGARKPDGNGRLPTDKREGEPTDWSGFFMHHAKGVNLLDHYKVRKSCSGKIARGFHLD